MMLCLLAVAVTALGLGTFVARVPDADAFGSIDSSVLGQKPVHEKITRVLGCDSGRDVGPCLQPMSLSILAGTNGTWGAVAEPDNPLDGNPNPGARHCDNADYGYDVTHSQAEAWAELTNCLAYFQQYMQFAVDSAAGLLNEDGTINGDQAVITNAFGTSFDACSLPDPAKGHTSNDTAKCNVFNGLGRALHLYEDFWSHSNWADFADPDQPVSRTNPAGLGRTDQPDFFAFPSEPATTFPEGLITGCDDSVSILSECGDTKGASSSGDRRVGHSALNKDNGTVSVGTCHTINPATTRGELTIDGTSNFSRAVFGACNAAIRAWGELLTAIETEYGLDRSAAITKALTADAPLTRCAVSGSAARALRPPVGSTDSSRSVDIRFVNTTGEALTCATAVLDGGEWSSYPPDAVAAGDTGAWRTQSNGVATGTEGAATFGVGSATTKVEIKWNDPYVGSNSFSCSASEGYKCETSGGKGNNTTITFTLSKA